MTEKMETIVERITDKAVSEAKDRLNKAINALRNAFEECGAHRMHVVLAVDPTDNTVWDVTHAMQRAVSRAPNENFTKCVEKAHQEFLHKVDALAQDYEDLKSIVEGAQHGD